MKKVYIQSLYTVLANKVAYMLDNLQLTIEMDKKARGNELNLFFSEAYSEKWTVLFNKFKKQ
ncbi:hypothetical protein [Bacillus sp. DHT2]|uniref:hypothetical protein n=1 Tax=Bacillus sp. DHT2 TaxID=2994532 RepID=UPI0022490D32|nr:hypothetical protein [Bacillus sp. DHT2]